MKTRALLLLLALAACEPASAPSGAGAVLAPDLSAHTGYTLTSLGVLPGQTFSEAAAVNDLNVIVGHSDSLAFWYRSGVLGQLASPDGAVVTSAQDINRFGHVVGFATLAYPQPFLWNSIKGAAIPIATSIIEGGAYSINDYDVVVGAGRSVGLELHAFRWSAAAGVTDLNPTWASSSGAYDIDNAGQVAGFAISAASGRAYAVRWDSTGTLTVLGILPGGDAAFGYAQYGGRVVGASNTSSGSSITQGFQWSAGSGMTQVTGFNLIAGLSSKQRIVGWAANKIGMHFPVTRLLSTSGVTTLPTLGGATSQANAVNTCGAIVGFSQAPGGPRRAVLWQQPACDP